MQSLPNLHWLELTPRKNAALDEVEANLATLTTYDELADFHDEGIFEIMEGHGADYRDCEEFNAVVAKIDARLVSIKTLTRKDAA